MVAGHRPLDNKIDTELQHLTTSVTATKFLKKFKADLEICDAMEEQVCDVPSQCPVCLKRRLSECSRRFHNHGEGPY